MNENMSDDYLQTAKKSAREDVLRKMEAAAKAQGIKSWQPTETMVLAERPGDREGFTFRVIGIDDEGDKHRFRTRVVLKSDGETVVHVAVEEPVEEEPE